MTAASCTVAGERAEPRQASSSPRFQSIAPSLVTPLVGADTLDVEGLERLVEHVVAGGVHGLFVLGTTGEGPSLSGTLQKELVDRVVRCVAAC